jgi:hypothetical protein
MCISKAQARPFFLKIEDEGVVVEGKYDCGTEDYCTTTSSRGFFCQERQRVVGNGYAKEAHGTTRNVREGNPTSRYVRIRAIAACVRVCVTFGPIAIPNVRVSEQGQGPRLSCLFRLQPHIHKNPAAFFFSTPTLLVCSDADACPSRVSRVSAVRPKGTRAVVHARSDWFRYAAVSREVLGLCGWAGAGVPQDALGGCARARAPK